MFYPLHFVLLSVALVDSSASHAEEDCVRSIGEAYRGKQHTTSSGLTCLTWTNATRDYDPKSRVDSETGVGDHNYCRNPDSSERPWCYIVSPDGTVQRQFCSIDACREQPSTVAAEAESLDSPGARAHPLTSEPAKAGAARGEGAAAQPVQSISQRVRTSSKKKKDLGTVGYVLASLMIAIIIILGVGVIFGYFYKRGRDLKKKHEQRVHEREMQRITLPLSAFSNPTCELVDENTIVIAAERDVTPVQEGEEGVDPLMGQQAGTPGA